MIIRYVADDGREFESENDCLEYERKAYIKKFSKEIRMFDPSGNRVPVENGITDVFYLEVTTDEAAEAFEKFYNDSFTPWDWNEMPKAGKWYYDENDDNWYLVQDLIDKVREIEKIFS